MSDLTPARLRSLAESVRFGGMESTAATLASMADEWEADQAVIDAVLNSDPLRRTWAGRHSCLFCGAQAGTPEAIVHERFCARLLAEFRRPDL